MGELHEGMRIRCAINYWDPPRICESEIVVIDGSDILVEVFDNELVGHNGDGSILSEKGWWIDKRHIVEVLAPEDPPCETVISEASLMEVLSYG